MMGDSATLAAGLRGECLMGVPYYERKTRTFTCDNCSWTGLGSEFGFYELYRDRGVGVPELWRETDVLSLPHP
jgi:hypothetical protein